MSVPLGERGGALRGVIDLVSGRLPGFVFGGGVGSLVPVFHFHDEDGSVLAAAFQYLRENHYRTLTADDLSAVARGTRPVREREVALCFDDAWARVWTDAAPLLRQYDLRAIVYAIPGRIADAPSVRSEMIPAGTSPFMTWPEIRSLHAAGTIDVQSHTWMHARVFTSSTVLDFVRPGYETGPPLNRPLLNGSLQPRFIEPNELGAPLYEHRSRMSDGRRVFISLEAHAACVSLAAAEGGAVFFSRPDWRQRLEAVVTRHAATVRSESEQEQREAIEHELDRSRSELNARLGTTAVRHVCLPWGVSGEATARALLRLGFESAVANRWAGMFAVRPGDDPFWLKRLPNRYVYTLPGRGRRTILSLGSGPVNAAAPTGSRGPTQFGNLEANLRFIAATGALRPGVRVLEIGSGTGTLLRRLRDDGYDIQGVELNASLIEEGRRWHGPQPVQPVTGTTLPFPDAAFDIVMSFDVFEHICDSDAHLREVRRVLRPGGQYLLQTPNKWMNSIFETIRWRSLTRWREDHCSLHSLGELRARLAEHGFDGQAYDVAVVNDFFREKVRQYAGWPGTAALTIVNPDRLPLALRTNLYVAARLTASRS